MIIGLGMRWHQTKKTSKIILRKTAVNLVVDKNYSFD